MHIEARKITMALMTRNTCKACSDALVMLPLLLIRWNADPQLGFDPFPIRSPVARSFLRYLIFACLLVWLEHVTLA
jgi:hypothetical protein